MVEPSAGNGLRPADLNDQAVQAGAPFLLRGLRVCVEFGLGDLLVRSLLSFPNPNLQKTDTFERGLGISHMLFTRGVDTFLRALSISQLALLRYAI